MTAWYILDNYITYIQQTSPLPNSSYLHCCIIAFPPIFEFLKYHNSCSLLPTQCICRVIKSIEKSPYPLLSIIFNVSFGDFLKLKKQPAFLLSSAKVYFCSITRVNRSLAFPFPEGYHLYFPNVRVGYCTICPLSQLTGVSYY